MINGRYISCQEVIGRVFRDNKYKYELPWNDAVEWSVDAIDFIGAPMALFPNQIRLTISNYRAMLPCDLHEVTQVAGSFDGTSVFSMRSKTNSFHPTFTCDTTVFNSLLIGEVETSTVIEQPIGEDISGNPVYDVGLEKVMSFPSAITDTGSNLIADGTYYLNDNYIFTNYKDGYVFIAYKAIPVDSDGFPLIPDNTRYIEGVKSFIRMKVDYILWRTGEITKDVFQYSEQEWLFYVNSAANSARMPNVDGMKSLMNQIKLIPSKYSHDEFFVNLSVK